MINFGDVPGGRAGQKRPAPPGYLGSRRGELERGMVTVELALGVGSLMIVVGLLVGVLSVVGLQLGCQSAVVDIARQAARGDTVAVQAAKAKLPSGASVEIVKSRRGLRAEVRAAARPWGSRLPAVPVSASATMVWEPGAAP